MRSVTSNNAQLGLEVKFIQLEHASGCHMQFPTTLQSLLTFSHVKSAML